MRKACKKLMVFLMAFSIMLTGIQFPGSIATVKAENESSSITVHYKGTSTTPNIYYWNLQSGSSNSVVWPGVAMTAEGDNWYGYTFDNATSVNLIFNLNGSQTADLSRTTGEWWYKDSQWYSYNPEGSIPVIEDQIKVHFKSTWGGAKVYYWGMQPSGTPVSWPGVSMESEGDDWYGYTLDQTTSTNLIFNYNGNQTADLSRTSGEWWYADGKWYSSNPDEGSGTGGDTGGGDEGGGTGGDEGGGTGGDTGGGDTGGGTGGDTGGGTGGGTDEPQSEFDFRDETIYFLMVTRFYDGDSDNNVHCWDEVTAMKESDDPAWRGDFKGLIEKLDYIKALGFSAVWITPVVKNLSGYDYHGYHAVNHAEVDPRYESEDATYQDLIDAAHDRGMKVIQDIVLNHTGNFGEENLYPLMTKDQTVPDSVDALIRIDGGKLPANYDDLTPSEQFQARLTAMKEDHTDTDRIYHHEKSLSWESYTVQTGQIAGDCVDLNTENPDVSDYLIDSYNQYIDMGVDAFRVDTVKHISRLTFNKEFVPAFKEAGGDDFFMFGEVATRYRQVWNSGIPAISTPFYTWKETKDYAWTDTLTREASVYEHWQDNQSVDAQPSSNNHLLNGNTYHVPDTSIVSGLSVIDFPMHWNFNNAYDAFGVAVGGDSTYSDATWNVTYVDSHDYAPDCAPENQRFAGSQDTWAENLNLMYAFRGIPCIYYGSEIEFKKGAPIDVGPNQPLSETGRAYFGDYIEGSVDVTDFAEYTNATGAMAETLSHPLSLHIQRLNQIRREIPALRKGQYSLEGVSGNMAFKRRYTDEERGIDSFVLVSITDGASFTGIPNGTYKDVITGDVKTVTNGTLSIASTQKGNMRIYVLDLPGNPAPGKIGTNGTYLK